MNKTHGDLGKKLITIGIENEDDTVELLLETASPPQMIEMYKSSIASKTQNLDTYKAPDLETKKIHILNKSWKTLG